MNGRMALNWAAFLLLETATQIVFKLAGAGFDVNDGIVGLLRHAVTSPWVIGGFTLYFGCFLLWMTILKESDLGGLSP